MKKFAVLLTILLFMMIFPHLFGQGLSFSAEYKGPVEPAFEKVYVQPHQLVTMPDGIYYFDDYCQSRKVKTVLADEDGMYVILIRYQCPLCGRRYSEKEPDEEYGCPIFKKRITPKIWVDK